MAASDVFFLPSRYEGIALTLYEALACGLPVVGARVGGQAELVTKDVGILVDPSNPEEETVRYADALASLLSNADRRRAMGVAARARIVTDFRLEQMGERMNRLLEHAIELHRSAPGPIPSPRMARVAATEAIELTRLAGETSWLWTRVSPVESGLQGPHSTLSYATSGHRSINGRWIVVGGGCRD